MTRHKSSVKAKVFNKQRNVQVDWWVVRGIKPPDQERAHSGIWEGETGEYGAERHRQGRKRKKYWAYLISGWWGSIREGVQGEGGSGEVWGWGEFEFSEDERQDGWAEWAGADGRWTPITPRWWRRVLQGWGGWSPVRVGSKMAESTGGVLWVV